MNVVLVHQYSTFLSRGDSRWARALQPYHFKCDELESRQFGAADVSVMVEHWRFSESAPMETLVLVHARNTSAWGEGAIRLSCARRVFQRVCQGWPVHMLLFTTESDDGIAERRSVSDLEALECLNPHDVARATESRVTRYGLDATVRLLEAASKSEHLGMEEALQALNGNGAPGVNRAALSILCQGYLAALACREGRDQQRSTSELDIVGYALTEMGWFAALHTNPPLIDVTQCGIRFGEASEARWWREVFSERPSLESLGVAGSAHVSELLDAIDCDDIRPELVARAYLALG